METIYAMSLKEVNLSKLVIPKYKKLIEEILDCKRDELKLLGGRGSTKSSFISLIIIYGIMEDYYMRNEFTNAIAIRKVQNTLLDSVYNQLLWAIDKLEVNHLWKCLKSPMSMTFLPSGQQILFRGCDDPLKLKSTKFKKGYPKYLWFEEYDQFEGQKEIRIIIQTIARGGFCITFLSYNPPPNLSHWVNEEERLNPTGIITTYLDVDKEWLGVSFIKNAEKLKKMNFKAYQNEYLGLVTGEGGEIFKNVKNITLTDFDIEQFNKIRQGLDFGFANDPTLFIKNCYQSNKAWLTIFDEYVGYEIGTNHLAEILHEKTIDYETIKADSAELRTINTLQTDYNLNISACKKGQDSVRHGIKFLQSLDTIFIDRKRCPFTYNEFISYEKEKNKEGKFKDSYPDKNNHSIDAVRYSLDDIILNTGWRIPK